MAAKVTLYIRQQGGSRKFKRAKSKGCLDYPPGTVYALRYTVNGKRVYETLTGCAGFDAAKERQAQKVLDLVRGVAPEPKPKPQEPKPSAPAASGPLMLDQAIDRYRENVQKAHSRKTASGYAHLLKQFFSCCGNKPAASVGKQDLTDFVAHLRREGYSDRTIHNRVEGVTTFLRKGCGVEGVALQVKFTEKKVRAYREDELEKLFAAADAEEWLLFQFFLCTGCREQETMNAEYNDLDFVDGLFNVREKSDWKPKDCEEREIPIPDFLLEALKKRMLSTKGTLIFPTKDGKKDGHMLRRLQALAKRAGLPGEWGLHKFRKSYATLQHRNGVDARTIQKRLGHSDLATTLAYLEGEEARSERSRSQVNDTFGKFALGSRPAAQELVN